MELVEGRSLADALPKAGLPLDRLAEDRDSGGRRDGRRAPEGHHASRPEAGEHHARRRRAGGACQSPRFRLGEARRGPPLPRARRPCRRHRSPVKGGSSARSAYMSPEQAEGKPIDSRSDLFSLGVILYEMATGQRPFTGDTSMSIISSIVKDTPTSVTDLNPALPRDLGRIVRRALVKDPTRRYQTAADLRNDLEELKTSFDSGDLAAAPILVGLRAPPGAGVAVGRARHRPRRLPRHHRRRPRSLAASRGTAAGRHRAADANAGVDQHGQREPARPLARWQVRRVHPAGGWRADKRVGAPDLPAAAPSASCRRRPDVRILSLAVTPDGNSVDFARGVFWRIRRCGACRFWVARPGRSSTT